MGLFHNLNLRVFHFKENCLARDIVCSVTRDGRLRSYIFIGGPACYIRALGRRAANVLIFFHCWFGVALLAYCPFSFISDVVSLNFGLAIFKALLMTKKLFKLDQISENFVKIFKFD